MKNATLALTLRTVLGTVILVGLTGCVEQTDEAPASHTSAPDSDPQPAATPASDDSVWEGKIIETMDASGYTYVLVDTGSEQIWAAGPKTTVKTGQSVIVPKGMMMPNFSSKTLDRVFDEIYFVNAFQLDGQMPPAGGAHAAPSKDPHGGMTMGNRGAKAGAAAVKVEGVAKVDDGYTVEEIFTKSAELEGKSVKVRGQVVKFTANIMGANWIHIQDGSGEGPTGDLTVTTSGTVAIGDLIVAEGPLSVNKDFGAGYKYSAIIEKAEITKE